MTNDNTITPKSNHYDFPHFVTGEVLVRNYSFQEDDQLISTKMEGGNYRHRRKTTTRSATAEVSFYINSVEKYELFRGWFLHIIGGGVSNFNARVYDGTKKTYKCQYIPKSIKKVFLNGNKWYIEMNLRILNYDLIDQDQFESKYYLGLDFDLIMIRLNNYLDQYEAEINESNSITYAMNWVTTTP